VTAAFASASRAPWPEGIDLSLLAGAGPLGLAVSGGGDSTALAVLLAEAGLAGLHVLTVDHGLRPGSADDAAAVEALAARLGLPCETLFAAGPPAGSLQAWARRERYRLMRQAAERRGLAAVVTAHTLDDQAETFLLRLARGSGLRGLGAMRPRAVVDGLTVLRPFLGTRRGALREALLARGIAWREDPSNGDPRFDRIAMRSLSQRLAAVGLTPVRLAAAAGHLERAGRAIDGAVAELAGTALRLDRAGAVTLARAPWCAAPEEVRLRLLADAVAIAGGAAFPPRLAALQAAASVFRHGTGRSTLGRAVAEGAPDRLTLWREMRGIDPVEVPPGTNAVFDGRYSVTCAPDAPPVTVAALGPLAGACPPLWHPGALAAAPGVFVADRLVAVPSLGVRRRDWPADTVRVARVR